MNLQKEIAALGNQRENIEQAITKKIHELSDSMTALDDDKFWEMLGILQEQFQSYHKTKICKVKSAVHNFFCYADEDTDEDIVTMLRFVKTYSDKVNALYKPLFNVIEGCGDDCYGDILDSFPLYGRKRFERALKGQPLAKGLVHKVEYDKVYQGENYIQMTLRNTLEKRSQSFDEEVGYADDRKYYDVLVHRITINEAVMSVQADSPERAEEIAMGRIPDHTFKKQVSEKFEVTSVVEVKDV